MFRLTLLGGLTLERIGITGDALSLRRRVLALLALVAGHGSFGLSRDKILAYLWPESDVRHARNSLKQALFSLRHTLGTQTLLASGDMIRLDPGTMQVDLWEFEDALNRHQAAQAVACYGGPFLDGFFVSGLQEYEEWADRERRRLARRRIEALEELAHRSTAANDHAAAVHWWRLVTEADPTSAAGALGLMRALEASGDRVAALEHARTYEARIQAEFGVPVDSEIRELIQRLRRPSRPVVPASEVEDANHLAPAGAGQPTGVERGVTERPRKSPAPTAPRTPAIPEHRLAGTRVRPDGTVAALARSPLPTVGTVPRPRSLTAVLLPLAVAVVLAGINTLFRNARSAEPLGEVPARLTVLPFETLGTGKDAELGRGLDALLISGMGGLEGYRLVPASLVPAAGRAPTSPYEASAEAARVGARYYVMGRLIATPAGLRATAIVHDRANADQEIGRSEATAGPGGLFELADELVRGLIKDLYRGPGQEMARAAAAATRSLPALKAYLEGERALAGEKYIAARDAFRRAFRADTAFALAYYRCSLAADRAGDEETARWSAELAARFSERLSEHDRRLVTAYIIARRGMLDDAERLYRGILADYPQDMVAWFQFGELLATSNPLRGRSGGEARFALERVLEAEPDHGDALVNLARLAALEGRTAEADSLLRRADSSSAGTSSLGRTARALVLDGRPGGEQVLRYLLTQPDPIPRRVVLEAATRVHDLEGMARFGQALASSAGTCDVRAVGHRILAQVAMAHGQAELFRRELDEAARCDSGATLELRALMAVQPFAVLRSGELAELSRSLRLAADTILPWASRSYYGALLALRVGDTLPASRSARVLLRMAETSADGQLARTFGRSLRARLRLTARRPAEALAQLEAAGWERVGLAQHSVAEVSDRFLRAELLHLLGRDEEAIGWYGSIAERAPYELAFMAPAELRLARIYDARGDAAQAAVHYRRFGELWRNADPELQTLSLKANAPREGLSDNGRKADP